MDAGEQTVELVKDQAEIPTLTFANTIKNAFRYSENRQRNSQAD